MPDPNIGQVVDTNTATMAPAPQFNTAQQPITTQQPVQQIKQDRLPTPANPYVDMYFEPIQGEPKPGDVITFVYNKKLYYEIHDRYPLVLVLDWKRGNRVRGVNLHYLSYSVMGSIIEMTHNGLIYSYRQVQPMQMCVDAFRHYIWTWIIQGTIRRMNTEAIQAEVNTIKKYGKLDEATIHQLVREQLQKKTQQLQATQPKGTTPTTPGLGPIAATPATKGLSPTPVSPVKTPLNTQEPAVPPIGNQ